MIHQVLNTLYVQTPHAYVKLAHDTLRVEAEGELLLQVPVQHLGAVVLFGDGMMSPQAMQRCVEGGRQVTFLYFSGRLRCRVEGPESGNVLLRLAQYEASRDEGRGREIARRLVAAKLRNSRELLLRAGRDASLPSRREAARQAAAGLAAGLLAVQEAATLDQVRGVEGDGAGTYFAAFGSLITAAPADFSFVRRTRRPARDRVNALLSFLYALLRHDCLAGAQGVGLDPQVGFLHAVRPGRPALALDLMEELRAPFADRLALNLINRRQIQPEHFDADEAAGSVLLNEAGRRLVITEYQKRKQEMTQHRLVKEKMPIGLVPLVQARLLARHLRGEIAEYHPYLVE